MSRPLHVAVVGGGIGGLAAAVALRSRGLDVTVFEQAAQLGEVGAGVQLQPNGLRVLERLGLGPDIARVGVPLGPASTYFRRDGTVVGPVVTTDSSGRLRLHGMHRADLLDLLARALPDGVVRTGHRCTGVEQTPTGVRMAFANGAVAEADLAVGADGIHSVLRDAVTEPAEPVYSGSVAYRGLLPSDALPGWPRAASQLWMGEGKHFLVFPVRSGELINYVGFVPQAGEALESWSAPGDPAALAAAFAGWDPRVENLLAQVRETFWWGLYDREPLDRWSRGRLTLLGDAAHPMLPHLGQGVNQAIEDAAVLATVLSSARPGEVPAALAGYEQRRRERTRTVQAGARANGRRYDSAYPDLRQRDTEIVDMAAFRRWIFDHDAWAPADPPGGAAVR